MSAADRWWNEDTTLAEFAVWYAKLCELTPENFERFVARLKAEGFDDSTFKQCAEEMIERRKNGPIGPVPPDLATAMEWIVDELLNYTLLGEPDESYYT
jgi:hypothetical protein